MQPISIPDHLVRPGSVRQVAKPADDARLAHVEDCQALVSRDQRTGLARVEVRLELEPGELEELQAGGHVWVTFLGGILPFSVSTRPDEEA